jgi:hypothetical protein
VKCADLLLALNEYVDGTLDPAVCEDFEKHLKGCNPCEVVIDNIRKTIKLYSKGDQVWELPADVSKRLHEAMRARWKQRPTGPG